MIFASKYKNLIDWKNSFVNFNYDFIPNSFVILLEQKINTQDFDKEDISNIDYKTI